MSSRYPHARPATLVGALVLMLFFLLGGGTRQGLPVESLLQVLGLALAAWILLTYPLRVLPSSARWLLGLWLGVAAWLGLQMLPLPHALWSQLPGREGITEGLALAGLAEPTLSISLNREATLRALLAWFPAIGMFLYALSLSATQRRGLLRWVLVLAAASAVFGFLQLADGRDSPLRWHEITNVGAAVGPFANRNHLAAALVVAIPIAALAIMSLLRQVSGSSASRPLKIAMAVGALALLLLGLAIAQSRAGVALAALAVVGCAALVWRARAAERGAMPGARRWLFAAVMLGVLAGIQLGLFGLLNRLQKDPLDDLRWTIAGNALDIAAQLGPLGAGAGAFVEVYAAEEPEAERFDRLINRAHNDWIEWRLGGGWPLMILIMVAVGIGLRQTLHAWRSDHPDSLWAVASSIGLGLLLLHSLVDYPLRTTSMACVAAVLLACLCSDAGASTARRSRSHPPHNA